MIRSSRLLVLMAISALALGACKKKTTPTQAATPVSAPIGTPENPTRSSTAGAPTGENSAAMQARITAARAAVLSPVYFEYDADQLRDDAKASLDKKIAIMNANPTLRVRVAGHSDERGSDEYNIALGRRRAEQAKKYMTDRGINGARLETTSFGRERPAVVGTTEDAWSKNRRDEFEVVAGDLTKAP